MNTAERKTPGLLWWAVIYEDGMPDPVGISPSRTCAMRKFLDLPLNIPDGSPEQKAQRQGWAKARRRGCRLVRIRITRAFP